MYHQIKGMKTTPDTATHIATYLMQVAEEYHRDNSVKSLLRDFAALETFMKQSPLPQTRQEFEDRAQLFAFLQLLKSFLQIKEQYMSRSLIGTSATGESPQ